MTSKQPFIGGISVVLSLIFLIQTIVQCEEIKQLWSDDGTGPKIVIVGAGVAGLAAATRLIENGYKKIIILEAENRIGGRVHSVKMGNWTVDEGAHWVHAGKGYPVYDMAAPLGLLEDVSWNETVMAFSDGTVNQEVIDKLFENDDDYLKTLTSVSLYDVVVNKSLPLVETKYQKSKKSDAFVNWVAKIRCTFEGCEDLHDVSARRTADYIITENVDLEWKGRGYGSFIDLILKRHEKSTGPPVDLTGILFLNSEVTKIVVRPENEAKKVAVHYGEGNIVEADVALVTVSLGVLKERVDTLFEPQLPPDKKQAIEAFGIGTIDVIVLRFPTIWWPQEVYGFGIVWLNEDKDMSDFGWEKEILIFATDNWSPYTLTAWVIGDAARTMEKLPIDQVQKDCMKVLKKFLSHKYTISEPVETIRSTWGTNPHFRGAYSFRTLRVEEHNINSSQLSYPLTNKAGQEVVLFAGEATDKHVFSTVEGAVFSGWREADRIISSHPQWSSSPERQLTVTSFQQSMVR